MARPVYQMRLAHLDSLGEDHVFALYVELGTIKKLMAAIFEADPRAKTDRWGFWEFHDWCRLTPEREERWQEAKKLRAHVEADQVAEAADEVTPVNAAAQRVKMNASMWRAEKLNREDYGPPSPNINVGLNFGGAWLEALKGIETPTAAADQLRDLGFSLKKQIAQKSEPKDEK